jgi:hypothetical protein
MRFERELAYDAAQRVPVRACLGVTVAEEAPGLAMQW